MLIPTGLNLGQYLTAHREGGLDVAVFFDEIGKVWTGPYGLTGPLITKSGVAVTQNIVLSPDAWTAEYIARYARDEGQAAIDLGAEYWRDLDEVRRAVLADIAHQDGGGNAKTGVGGLAGYRRMLDAIRVKDWIAAPKECLDSLDHRQTPTRCEENAQMLASGQWPSWIIGV